MSHDTKLDGRVRFGSSFAYVQNVITASGAPVRLLERPKSKKKRGREEEKKTAIGREESRPMRQIQFHRGASKDEGCNQAENDDYSLLVLDGSYFLVRFLSLNRSSGTLMLINVYSPHFLTR